jgi:hypothetical protein
MQFSKKRWLILDCEIILHSMSLLRGDLIKHRFFLQLIYVRVLYKIRATPPYKDIEGVEFTSNFLQIEIRNVCRLFLFIVRKL